MGKTLAKVCILDSTTYSLILNTCSINVKDFFNFHKSIFPLTFLLLGERKQLTFLSKKREDISSQKTIHNSSGFGGIAVLYKHIDKSRGGKVCTTVLKSDLRASHT